MIKNNQDLQPSAPSDTAQSGCRAHWLLNEWQIRQYRKAIDENMWYMGERFGRRVTWEEAEYDFLHNEYYGCAPKWRKEYCANRCPHIVHCKLGQRFTKE